MNEGHPFRKDVKEVVRFLRPVLQDLNIRNETGHPPVFLASGKYHLDFLNLDGCSIQFAVGDIDAEGIFMMKYTQQGLLRAYIILNKKLYTSDSKSMREIRKIAGVHEFVHFIAIIYVATVIETTSLCSSLLHRLRRNVDKLWGPNLLELYNALSGQSGYTPPELTDAHFRIGAEGDTPDYDVLFLHFIFSRELFEAYFNETMQARFKVLYASETTRNEAVQLLLDMLDTAANDKDVPYTTARNQLLEWAHVYMRP